MALAESSTQLLALRSFLRALLFFVNTRNSGTQVEAQVKVEGRGGGLLLLSSGRMAGLETKRRGKLLSFLMSRALFSVASSLPRLPGITRLMSPEAAMN